MEVYSVLAYISVIEEKSIQFPSYPTENTQPNYRTTLIWRLKFTFIINSKLTKSAHKSKHNKMKTKRLFYLEE